MNSRTRTAILGSIRKWKDILSGKGVDKGVKNCPLCQEFYKRNLLSLECQNCPVFLKTGEIGCVGTPYEEWRGIWEEAGMSPLYVSIKEAPEELRPRLRAAASAVLDFLRSLLPPASEEPSR